MWSEVGRVLCDTLIALIWKSEVLMGHMNSKINMNAVSSISDNLSKLLQ